MGGASFEENTFKNTFYQEVLSEEEGDLMITSTPKNQSLIPSRKRTKKNIDSFFDKCPSEKKRIKVQSSSVSRSVNGGTSYISTGLDDAPNASHLIKIEIFDLKKLKKIPQVDHWKHANLRIKLYSTGEEEVLHQGVSDAVYNITKTIASKPECKKYFFTND